MTKVFIFDPTANDPQSFVRGVGRYLQILKENFPKWNFINKLDNSITRNLQTVLINPFFNFLQKPLTMRRIAQKQIAVIHDLIPLKYPKHFPAGIRGKINIFLNRIALKNYDFIITDSYTSKKDILQILKIQEKKVKVIYPCLPNIFLMKNQIENWKLEIGNFCLYVGDATWNKNLINLAKAIKIINVTCVFVGKVFEKLKFNHKISITKKILNSNNQNSKQRKLKNSNLFGMWNLEFNTLNLNHPWQKELRGFLEEIKNDKRFIFLGFIDDYRLIKLYQQARCNILISQDEGFGFSYLEAASQGCPSVISKIDVLKEISQNQGVIFADPKNPNDIADKIGEIYFNDALKKKLGFEAQKRSNFFSEKQFKENYQKIIYE